MANGSSLGVQNLPVVYNPMQAMTTAIPAGVPTSMGAEGTSSGGTIVGPGKMMIDLLQTIAQGIINLVDMTKEILDIETREEVLNRLRLRDERISAGDVAPKPDEAPKAEKKDSMLDTLMKQFKGFGPTAMAIAGVLAMIAAIALLNKYSDQIAALLAPILKFMNETLIPNIREIHNIIMDAPGGYFTALGAVGLATGIVEFFGVRGKLSRLFSSATATLRGVFDPKTLMLRENSKTWTYKLTQAIVGKSKRGPGGGGLLWKITGFFTRLSNMMSNSFAGRSALRVFSTIRRTTRFFVNKLRSIFRILQRGTRFLSRMTGLTRFLKLGLGLSKAIPILGQIVMAITGIFGFITGAIEGYKESGWSGAIIGGLKGLWDGLFGEFLNLIADILGWIAKKFGMEGLGNFLAKLDFTSEGIWKFFTEWLPGLFGDIKNAAVNAFNNTIQLVKDFFTKFNLGEIVVNKVRSLFLVVINLFNKMKRGFLVGINKTIALANKIPFVEIPLIDVGPAESPDIDTSMDEEKDADYIPPKYHNPKIKAADSGTSIATKELLDVVTGQKGELATSHMRQTSTIVAPVTTTDSSTNVNQTVVYPSSVDPADATALALAKRGYAHYWMSQ